LLALLAKSVGLRIVIIMLPTRDLLLADKIALLEQIKNQSSNISIAVDITGVPKYTVARVIQMKEKLGDEWTLRQAQQGTPKDVRLRVRFMMFQRPTVSASLP
jgi:hypothetical protein